MAVPDYLDGTFNSRFVSAWPSIAFDHVEFRVARNLKIPGRDLDFLDPLYAVGTGPTRNDKPDKTTVIRRSRDAQLRVRALGRQYWDQTGEGMPRRWRMIR